MDISAANPAEFQFPPGLVFNFSLFARQTPSPCTQSGFFPWTQDGLKPLLQPLHETPESAAQRPPPAASPWAPQPLHSSKELLSCFTSDASVTYLLLPEQWGAGYHSCAKEDMVHTVKHQREVHEVHLSFLFLPRSLLTDGVWGKTKKLLMILPQTESWILI